MHLLPSSASLRYDSTIHCEEQTQSKNIWLLTNSLTSFAGEVLQVFYSNKPPHCSTVAVFWNYAVSDCADSFIMMGLTFSDPAGQALSAQPWRGLIWAAVLQVSKRRGFMMSTLNNGLLWFQDVNRLVVLLMDFFFFIPYTGFDFALCSLQVFRKYVTSASLKDKAQYLKSRHFTGMIFFFFLDENRTS